MRPMSHRDTVQFSRAYAATYLSLSCWIQHYLVGYSSSIPATGLLLHLFEILLGIGIVVFRQNACFLTRLICARKGAD